MRIWGIVLVVVGVLFLVLLALAQLGGGHPGMLGFIVSLMLVGIGWNLRTSGTGIVKTSPAAAPAAAPGPQDAATVELPLTPEVAALIARQNARTLRVLLYLSGGFIAFFAVLGIVIGIADGKPNEGLALSVIFAGLGIMTAIMILGISWFSTLQPVRRDLR